MEIARSHSPPLRLLVIDDEELVRDGLVCLFQKAPGVQIEASAAGAASAVELLQGKAADVVLVDVCVGISASWDGVTSLQQALPQARIVVLDDAVRDIHLRRVLRLGLHGYAAKRDSFGELLDVVRKAGRGEQAFSQSARQRLVATTLGWQLRVSESSPGLHLLTVRETEVLACLAHGHTSRVCATLLKIRPSTVENHKAKIMKKLKIHRMVDLAKFAMREGLIPH
jgi:DNA-binding NarL/FixJ family response regulator